MCVWQGCKKVVNFQYRKIPSSLGITVIQYSYFHIENPCSKDFNHGNTIGVSVTVGCGITVGKSGTHPL